MYLPGVLGTGGLRLGIPAGAGAAEAVADRAEGAEATLLRSSSPSAIPCRQPAPGVAARIGPQVRVLIADSSVERALSGRRVVCPEPGLDVRREHLGRFRGEEDAFG